MRNIFMLSLKKIREDISHSVVLICCIVLLCTIITVFGNISYYLEINIRDLVSEEINQKGIDIEIIGLNGKYLDNKDISLTIEKTETMSPGFVYDGMIESAKYAIDSKSVTVLPFFAYGMANPFELIKGDVLNEDADGSGFIWLSQDFDYYDIGDKVTLKIDGKDNIFVVKGIVNEKRSYIDYRNFDMKNLYCIDTTVTEGVSVISTLKKLSRDFEKYYDIKPYTEQNNYSVVSDILSTYDYLNKYFLIVAGVCLFLIAITIALAFLGLVNAVKINNDKNRKFFGMLKSLGLKDNGIMFYNLSLWIFYILIGVAAAAIISSIILHFSLANVMAVIFELAGYAEGMQFIVGFAWWIPFVCICVMLIICLILAKIESKRLSKTEISQLLKGEQ